MEIIDNKTIVRRFVEEIENTGDVTNIREFISEDYLEVHHGEPFQIGIKGAIDHAQGVRRVFPDLKMTIENRISEGEWVATVYSVAGTFKEEMKKVANYCSVISNESKKEKKYHQAIKSQNHKSRTTKHVSLFSLISQIKYS